MSLASAVSRGPQVRRRCSVANWLASLDDVDRDAFDSAATNAKAHTDGWTVSGLWRLCLTEGLDCQRDKFAKHLNGECACGPR